MKINKFAVESELAVDENGILTGWFKLPAAPHAKYTIEIDASEVITPVVEEIDAEEACDTCGRTEADWPTCDIHGDCPHLDVRAEKVLLPGGEVAKVTEPDPTLPATGEVGGPDESKPTE